MAEAVIDADWQRPPPGREGYRRDAITAVLLLVGTLVSVWLYGKIGLYNDTAPAWVCVLWAIALTLPLAARRRFPVTVMAINGGCFMASWTLHVPELLFCNITFFLAFYTVGAWGRNRTVALVSRGVMIAVMFCWLFASLILGGHNSGRFSTAGDFSPYLAYGLISVITNLLYFGAAYYFGESAFGAAKQRAALAARTADLIAEREHSAAQAVALDRVHIARELHDVVAHHVSVMGVQAGAARLTLASAGEDAAERTADSLTAIETSARTAVDELHTMLRTLRQDEQPDSPRTSTSTRGIDQLDILAREASDAGVPTRVSVIGEERALPGIIEVTVYRLAQEALTNARKHGGAGAQADVRLRYLDDALELEVSDDGLGSAAVARSSAEGLGVVGMRERVDAVGGSIEVGPKPRGGFLVRARFPVAQDAVADTGGHGAAAGDGDPVGNVAAGERERA